MVVDNKYLEICRSISLQCEAELHKYCVKDLSEIY